MFHSIALMMWGKMYFVANQQMFQVNFLDNLNWIWNPCTLSVCSCGFSQYYDVMHMGPTLRVAAFSVWWHFWAHWASLIISYILCIYVGRKSSQTSIIWELMWVLYMSDSVYSKYIIHLEYILYQVILIKYRPFWSSITEMKKKIAVM